MAQVEASVAAIAKALGLAPTQYRIAYQSRVGPLEWVGPSTDDVILASAKAGQPIVVVPVAFVSEHSETLVELDIEYRHLAETNGAPAFIRAPTVATHPAFIAGLATLVQNALAKGDAIRPGCTNASCAGKSQCALTKTGL